jgi:hypothetical protein
MTSVAPARAHSSCAEDAEAWAALREGRRADAEETARRWWERTRAGTDELVLAGDLLARCLASHSTLPATPSVQDELRQLYLSVADAPGTLWVFTPEGERCSKAQATAFDWLARDAMAVAWLESIRTDTMTVEGAW